MVLPATESNSIHQPVFRPSTEYIWKRLTTGGLHDYTALIFHWLAHETHLCKSLRPIIVTPLTATVPHSSPGSDGVYRLPHFRLGSQQGATWCHPCSVLRGSLRPPLSLMIMLLLLVFPGAALHEPPPLGCYSRCFGVFS